MGHPDGQRLERQSTRMTDEKNWPLIRISAESQTPEDVVKSLAEMPHDDLFRLFSGMESIYANMLLLAVRSRMVPESSEKGETQHSEHRKDRVQHGRGGSSLSETLHMVGFQVAQRVSHAGYRGFAPRVQKNMLVCGPVRHITVGFRFSLRLPYTLATPSGTKKTFRHIFMTVAPSRSLARDYPESTPCGTTF